ncbi:MAG TPA: serine acetyltransferase [Thermodesulfobacteriota bacterium]|nr:serine acetyltransferase [Thermodesulfobacteriota bacterium]
MLTIDDELIKQVCETGYQSHQHFREELPKVVEDIVDTCRSGECFEQLYSEVIPSREAIIEIIYRLREILFPGYFNKEKTDPVNLTYQMGQSISVLFEMLAEQISRSFQHDCLRYHKPCIKCSEQGENEAVIFLKSIPKIRRLLATDVRAAYEGDPASQSFDEIIFSYPGIFAIMVYRIAHELYKQKIPLIPRIMTEYAHSVTGIDIHPGARIGESFFIDHGTGVVIGETTEIGKNVRLYQGVTLGALSLPKDAGAQLRGKKRHPTIEDDVIIYAEATILGEKAVIGARSVVGGNVWITDPVPPDTRVLLETPHLIYK